MNTRALIVLILPLVAVAPRLALAARGSPEVHPPQRRQAAVASAEALAQRATIAKLPSDLPSPFAPPDFDKPEGAELKAEMLAAQQRAAAAAKAKGTITRATPSDKDMLVRLAAQIMPTGTIDRNGAPHLMIAGKFFAVGTRFTATYNNNDYELELVAIDRSTFTLRYRGEQTTRPIKTVR
ncbi:MAG: hypothetical protein JNL39_15800 [Opitutaceae bacterium]|nr:hypothetical protein [Opitutaceae bacterium]